MPTTEIGRTGPLPRTAWADRVRLLADAKGVSAEGLGDLVESELARLDGLLLTTTPTDELDEISRWQRLADAAWCGQARGIVAAHNRMNDAEREFLGCEIALALNLSDAAAQDIVATALLAADAPGLIESVEAGMLTVRHVHAVLRALSGTGLSTEEQHAVVTIALARYAGQTPAQLAALVAKLVLTVNAAAAAAREADATYRRHVRFRAIEDGQGLIVARGPLADVERVRAALEAAASAGDDDRTRDAVLFDMAVELLTSATPGAPGGDWTASIVIPYSTAAGNDLELAEIPGLGPVLPETARSILAGAGRVQRIVVDTDGNVVEVSDLQPGPASSATDRDPRRWLDDLATMPIRIGIPLRTNSYQPSDRLRRHVQARYRTCTFPGCARPAHRSDLDHRVPWPIGLTEPDNLHPLCRRHHPY